MDELEKLKDRNRMLRIKLQAADAVMEQVRELGAITIPQELIDNDDNDELMSSLLEAVLMQTVYDQRYDG